MVHNKLSNTHNALSFPPPAKLNLMLHITGRRDDGYHDLQTVFQFIDYADELEFRPRCDDRLVRVCDDFDVPEDEDIIMRAASLLRERYRQDKPSAEPPCGIDIQLQQKIPMGAGLGAGSSDAATTLVPWTPQRACGSSLHELSPLCCSRRADIPFSERGVSVFRTAVV